MNDEEITKLVMDLSKSWKNRLVFNTKPFEDDMIEMCKKVRLAVEDNFEPLPPPPGEKND
jgi:hypothetical protein